MRCTALEAKKHVVISAMTAAGLIPLASAAEKITVLVLAIPFVLLIALFLQLIYSFRYEKPMQLGTMLSAFFAGGVYPVMLSSLVRVGTVPAGAAYILLPIIITFSCDSGAYFAGSFFGKHKLAPIVSPDRKSTRLNSSH